MGLNFDFIDGMKKEETATDTAVALVKHDLANVKQKFEGYRVLIQDMKKKVDAFEVKTENDAAELTAALGKVASLKSEVDEQRKEIIKPQDTFVRGVNSFVKSFRDILDDITRTGKRKIGEHGRMMELKRRAEERKLEEARIAEQKRLDKLAKKEGVTAPVVPKMVAPVSTKPIKTSSGSAHVRMVWTYRVENLDKIPRDYLKEDDLAIKRAIGAGIREIPGIVIFEEPKTMIRKG